MYHFSLGNYSLFAVVVAMKLGRYTSTDHHFIEKPIERLVSGIPNKIKFVLSWIPISVPEASESLVVIAYSSEYTLLEHLMPVISKRWQTLDLISMVEELKRSFYAEFSTHWFLRDRLNRFELVSVKDSLSSRPRFKKEEYLTDSA